MRKLARSLFPILAITLILGIASGSALAQAGNSASYFTSYYSNANTAGAQDATVRMINDGGSGGTLWAAIYVFDDSQELQECCACLITPDGLLSESVNKQLTANPLTGRLPKRGVIKVISSMTGDPTNTMPYPGIRAWATHIQASSGKTFAITEAAFLDSNLGSFEQPQLDLLCFFDLYELSGQPCTCTPEDHDF
jgi:hypothetical protein